MRPLLLACVLSACAPSGAATGGDDDGNVDVDVPGLFGSAELDDPVRPPLVTDACDEDLYEGVAWSSATSAHFAIHFLPVTAADHDQAAILARLESAYGALRLALGVTAEPTISVYLSPSRIAADAHGRAAGRAWPGEDRYEVVYTGAADSFEVLRYGHELTHVLEYHIDPARPRRHPLLTEGLAEYLDQSGRDLHDAYALQLLAGDETRVRVASFEDRDLRGKNYGRAGSLVQFLVERYGMAAFLDLFRATAVTWSDGCWTAPGVGCVGTPDDLTAMLDGALVATVGERWSAVQPAWQADVEGALDAVDVAMPDRAEIEDLFARMDRAIEDDDAELYRSTMEGFYCDWGGEAMRLEIAGRAVAAFMSTRTRIVAIVPTGVQNFRTAQVSVVRTDARGLDSVASFWVEHVPLGWRVSYGPDWY